MKTKKNTVKPVFFEEFPLEAFSISDKQLLKVSLNSMMFGGLQATEILHQLIGSLSHYL